MKKCVLIGLGNIGMNYDLGLSNDYVQTHLRAISLHSEFELVCGVDYSQKALNDFKDHFGVTCYENVLDLLKSDEVFDTAIIATNTENLYQTALLLIEDQRTQFLIIEKPVSVTLSEVEKLEKLVRNRKIKCVVNILGIL